MKETAYIGVVVVLGLLFFVLAVLALYWATKSGHWKNLNQAAHSIFNEDEPEGVQTDFFPGKNKKSQK